MRRIFLGPLSNFLNFENISDSVDNFNRATDSYNIVDEKGNNISSCLDIAIPGIPRENVSVNIDGNRIIVEVSGYSNEGVVYIRDGNNIDKSGFKITYNIDNSIYDINKVSATVKNGILTIIVPYVAKPKIKSIKIN